MNKVQQEKIAAYEECNRRRMLNENIATCKSVTWNRAIHKKCATQTKAQKEKITTQKSATWKERNLKKVQDEIIKISTVEYRKSAKE